MNSEDVVSIMDYETTVQVKRNMNMEDPVGIRYSEHEVEVKQEINNENSGQEINNAVTDTGKNQKLDSDFIFTLDNAQDEVTCSFAIQQFYTDDRRYACDECGKTFSHLCKLVTHRRIHTGEKPFQCEECGKKFSQRGTLNRHRRCHIGEKSKETILTETTFSIEGSEQEGKVKQKVSEAVTSTEIKQELESDYSFTLENPEKEISSISTQNYIKNTEDGPYTCEECGKTFVHLCKFITHRRIHSGEKPFQCEECGKKFSQKGTLNRHRRTHISEKSEETSLNENASGIEGFEGEPEVKQAISNSVKSTEIKQELDSDYSFTLENSEQEVSSTSTQNYKKNTEDGPYACEECGKTFVHLCKLIPHRRIHTGEKPFQCTECGKKFSQKGTLNRHRRTHTSEKIEETSLNENASGIDCFEGEPEVKQAISDSVKSTEIKQELHSDYSFTLDNSEQVIAPSKECGKSFSQKGTLNRHRLTHTNEKSEEMGLSEMFCDKGIYEQEATVREEISGAGTDTGIKQELESDYSFALESVDHKIASSFTKQRLNNTFYRRYTCEECGKTFSQSCNLVSHRRIHTGEKPYQCGECGKKFSQVGTLNRHRRSHISEKNEEACLSEMTYDVGISKHEPDVKQEISDSIVNTEVRQELQSNYIFSLENVGHGRYACEKCGRTFSQSCNLVDHHRVHSGEKPYQCGECEKTFSQIGTLNRHRQTHIGKKREEVGLTKKAYDIGVSENEPNIKQEINETIRNTEVRQELESDYIFALENVGHGRFTCEECGKRFSHSCKLVTHRRIHTGEKPYQCEECGKTFSQKGTLNRHRRVHTGEKSEEMSFRGEFKNNFTRPFNLAAEKPYECEECGKVFARSDHLVAHRLVHTVEEPYRCEECGKAFTQTSELIRHRPCCNSEKSERTYVSGNPEKDFTQPSSLATEKRYECEKCGKTFARPDDLVVHCRMHTGEQPYRCEKCGKTFSQRSNLNHHYLLHSDDKPFVCDDCGKAFKRSTDLTSHRRIHSGKKSYACENCGKAFVRPDHLEIHCLIHTGEQPHRCEQCGKTFTQRGTLNRHRRSHTGESSTIAY